MDAKSAEDMVTLFGIVKFIDGLKLEIKNIGGCNHEVFVVNGDFKHHVMYCSNTNDMEVINIDAKEQLCHELYNGTCSTEITNIYNVFLKNKGESDVCG